MCTAFIAELSRQLEQATPVWENSIYIDPPVLCGGDGPVGVFRQWCRQFYPKPEYTHLCGVLRSSRGLTARADFGHSTALPTPHTMP